MTAGLKFSAQAKAEAVKRELGYRRRVYARRIAEGKMRQEQADREIAIFEDIERDYLEQARGSLLL